MTTELAAISEADVCILMYSAKIADIKFVDLEIPVQHALKPAWQPSARYKVFPLSLVRICTDVGCVGNAIELTPQHLLGAKGSQIRYLRLDLLGADGFDVEGLVRKLRYTAFVGPRPWALEGALWDAIGKICGEPIHCLLGGAQKRLKAYVSTIEIKEPEEQVREVRRYFQQGFKAVKLRAHRPDPAQDVEVIKMARDAVGGEMEIIVDANQAWATEPPFWSLKTAIWMAKELEKLNVSWIEEPLPKDDISGLRTMARKVDLPIAGGELESGIHRFREFLESGAYQVVQPDPHWWGGILECRKISALADSMNKLCVLHTGGISGLWLAANLQMAGSLPNCPYFEYVVASGLQERVRNALITQPIVVGGDGYIDGPNAPGCGVEIDEDAVENYTVAHH